MKRLVIIILLLRISLSAICQSYPEVPEIKHPVLFNEQLSYTSSLLHQHNAVRILIYGQSISVQQWWRNVKTYFESKYPKSKLSIINKAIGGFSSERLKLTVANDVASFYPDLILFHDFGSEQDYEKIIQIIQSKTTADIAIQTDHMANQDQEWHDRHSNVWMPELCRKYGLALLDIRKYWKLYMIDNNLQIKSLLVDGVHLNDHGNYLMAGIIKNYFDNLTFQGANDNRIKTLKRGKDFSVKKNVILIRFTGNRIDVQTNTAARAAPIRVMVDEQPLHSKGCYYYTRPSLLSNGTFLTKIGFLIAMELSDKVEEEDWLLSIISIDSVQQQISYSIRGSKTGEDGTGKSNESFTSRSGKIIIMPHFWFIRASKGDFGQFNWLKPGDVLQWQTKSMCHENMVLLPSMTQTLFQVIGNGRHQLKIAGPGVKHIKQVSVYNPQLTE